MVNVGGIDCLFAQRGACWLALASILFVFRNNCRAFMVAIFISFA